MTFILIFITEQATERIAIGEKGKWDREQGTGRRGEGAVGSECIEKKSHRILRAPQRGVPLISDTDFQGRGPLSPRLTHFSFTSLLLKKENDPFLSSSCCFSGHKSGSPSTGPFTLRRNHR